MLKFRIQDIVLTSWGQFPNIRSSNQFKYYQPPPGAPPSPPPPTPPPPPPLIFMRKLDQKLHYFLVLTQALDFFTLVLLTNCTSALKRSYNYLNSLVRSKNPFRKNLA